MKIEKIQKMKSGKYKISFNEEEITTYDDVILEHGLLYHPEVDVDMIQKLHQDTSYYDIYYKAVNYIMRRLRSEKEIREYLDKLDALENTEKIITSLKEVGLLNDKVFAHAYLYDKLHLTNIGPYRIRQELESLGIDDVIIQNEIENIDEEILYEKLKKMISKKVSNNHKYSVSMLKQKILEDMIQLGYERFMIFNVLDTIDVSEDLLEKEYQKIYSKYSKKYSGVELKNKIKQKLYQKGFELRDIESLLLQIEE